MCNYFSLFTSSNNLATEQPPKVTNMIFVLLVNLNSIIKNILDFALISLIEVGFFYMTLIAKLFAWAKYLRPILYFSIPVWNQPSLQRSLIPLLGYGI
jgi:hypothetical protein